MVRVRQGDTVNLTFDVPEDMNVAMHNVDFHAVYGPGGGCRRDDHRPQRRPDPDQIPRGVPRCVHLPLCGPRHGLPHQ